MIKKLISKLKIAIFSLSLRTKITLIIISVSLLAIMIGFTAISIMNIIKLKRDLVSQNSVIAKLMGEYSLFGLMFDDTKSVVENLKNLDAIEQVISAEVFDHNGEFFASFHNTAASQEKLIVSKPQFEFKPEALYIFEPIKSPDGQFQGTILLKVSLVIMNKNVNNYLLWLFITIVIVTAITILFANSFQQIISKPILRLAEVATKVTESNDYTLRIKKQSNDEIGILYDGFNQMLEEIARNQVAMLNVQNKLKDSEEQFSTFMKMLPAAAFIKDKDSNYLYVNKFLTDNFFAKNWIGKKIIDTLPSQKKHFSSEFDVEALNEVQHNEEFLYDSKNELRYFETWKFPIQRKEKETLIGAIAIDTTNRKLIENQVNYYVKELERNNKELEEFNYVASHDLREPLRTITSYCELLSEDLGPNLSEMVKEDINFITNATTRMNVLIQDLLQLSRAGRIEFKHTMVDLNEIVELVLKDIELKIKETNSKIIIENLPIVYGDAIQLSRVFQNLITNAIKFKSKSEPVINISAIEKTNHFEISVQDNGIGVDKQYFQQIFSAFKRLHSRDEYEGTGIGLAICKKIIERHAGTIWLESEPGKGCNFTINLKKG